MELGIGEEYPTDLVSEKEQEIASEMVELIKRISIKRYPDGQYKRFNQVKTQGCFEADLCIEANLPFYTKLIYLF